MRSPKRVLVEKVRTLSIPDGERYVDLGARVRVYRRDSDGQPVPAEWLPWVFGGKYDRLTACYVGPPDLAAVRELKIHSGQIGVVNAIGSGQRRIVSVGPPGGGKTEGNVTVACLLALERCNGIGGMVVPVAGAQPILWDKFLNRAAALGWVDGEPAVKRGEVRLKNGTLLQFRSTAKQSRASKSPIAGLDWHWAVPDEEAYMDDDAMREIEARGRINADFQMFSSATNEPIHDFQMRLLRYEADPHTTVVRYSGPDNCFTPIEHWDALKRDWSDEDYRRRILCEDVPLAGRVYPTFDYRESTRPLPTSGDITAQVISGKFRNLTGVDWLVGWDPGSTMSASAILKCFDAGGGERAWYIVDEVSTQDATTEFHGRDLIRWFQSRNVAIGRVLVVGDPHENKDTDRSDYLQLQACGFTVKRSNSGEQIERKHRLSMVNALLRDATGRRRLFLAASQAGPPKAQKTAESFGHLMYTPRGDIEFHGKTIYNLAHWSDAPGYALFPFEHFRGSYRGGSGEGKTIAPPGGIWRFRSGA